MADNSQLILGAVLGNSGAFNNGPSKANSFTVPIKGTPETVPVTETVTETVPTGGKKI